jgi:peptide/nickel transport system permease protein
LTGEPSTANQGKPTGPPVSRGQGQWGLIGRQFRRRRLAVYSSWLILLLVTTSVLAPFLANDRPIAYRGSNRFEYRDAFRTTLVVSGQAMQGNATSGDTAEILNRQIERLALELPDESTAELRGLEKRLTTAINSSDRSAIGSLRTELRRRFDIRNANLRSRWQFPVLASLDWSDILFLSLILLFWTLPLWCRMLRLLISAEHPMGRPGGQLALFVVLPALAAIVWHLSVPQRIDRTDYKTGVWQTAELDLAKTPAHVVFETVTWPLIAYGLDEDNLDARYLAYGKESPKPKTEIVGTTWGGTHWLGTDGIGRDVLCRMIWGGRISLAVGVVAVSIYMTIGIIVGSIAGYFGGWTDMIISRLIEIVIVFPSFFLILTIVAFIGPSIFNIMIVIGVTGWTGVARLVRGEFLRLGQQEFVLAGRALGYSPMRIIFRHVLPNALAPVLVSATFGIAGAILTESALSFLGFGITIPKPSWGGILASGREAIFRAPWLIYFPGFAIFLTITAYNLVGEALRDAADPRLRGQR